MTWFLNFIPSWVPHLIVILGLIGLVGSFVFGKLPFVSKYILPVQIGSGLLLAIGMWTEGVVGSSERWKSKVADLEATIVINQENAKIALAEEKSKTVNTVVQYKYIDRIKVVKDIQIEVHEKIKEAATRIDSDCRLSAEAVEIINTSAKSSK